VSERALGERGLHESTARLGQALQRVEDEAAVLISLAEALAWLYSLEEFHKKRMGKDAYRIQRDSATGGAAMAGLIFARGRFAHSLIAPAGLVMRSVPRPGVVRPMGRVSPRGGAVFIGAPLVNVPGFEWSPRSALPGRKTGEKDGSDQHYARHVERRPVVEPISAAADFLRELP